MNEVYIGKLESTETPGTHDGSWVVALFNRSPLPRPLSVDLHRLQFASERVGVVDSWTATDIWVSGWRRAKCCSSMLIFHSLKCSGVLSRQARATSEVKYEEKIPD